MLRRRLPSPRSLAPVVVLAGVGALGLPALPAFAEQTPPADAAFDKPFSVPQVEAADPAAPLYVRQGAAAPPAARNESGAAQCSVAVQAAGVEELSHQIKTLTYFAAGAAVLALVLFGLLLQEVRALRAGIAALRK